MELNVAIEFISKAFLQTKGSEKWADLGCGDGLFTRALYSILPSGSKIESIDINPSINLQSIELDRDIEINPKIMDMNLWVSKSDQFDGILMANSLHYIENKSSFIEQTLKKVYNGKMIIIEYDTTNSNKWVPYPITFSELESVVLSIKGSFKIEKMYESPSIFRSGMIYSALISQ